MNDITPREELLVAHALVSDLIRERGQLVAKLKIATESLEYLSHGAKAGKTARHMSTMAEDALIQISVMD